MTRLSLTEDQWTERQRQAADAIRSGPRGTVRGPFLTLLHSPDVAERIQHLGEGLRFKGELAESVRETAILVTAQAWKAEYEWKMHKKLALEAGLTPDIVDLIEAERPIPPSVELGAVIDFCRELHATHRVSDEVYRRAENALGRSGVVELIALCGYYAMIAMVLNVADISAPVDAA